MNWSHTSDSSLKTEEVKVSILPLVSLIAMGLLVIPWLIHAAGPFSFEVKPKVIVLGDPAELELSVAGIGQDDVSFEIADQEVTGAEEMSSSGESRRFKLEIDPAELGLQPGWIEVSMLSNRVELSLKHGLGVIEQPLLNGRAFTEQLVEVVVGDTLSLLVPKPEGFSPQVRFGTEALVLGADDRLDIAINSPESRSIEVTVHDHKFQQQILVHASPISVTGATMRVDDKGRILVSIEGLKGKPRRLILQLEASSTAMFDEIELLADSSQSTFAGMLDESILLLKDRVHIEWQGKKLWGQDGRWIEKQPGSWRWEQRSQQSELRQRLEQMVAVATRGTITLRGIKLELVPIPVHQTFKIGLTRQQRLHVSMGPSNLGQMSSIQSGPLEVRLLSPLLMQVYEVTNEQYLVFLRDCRERGLPIEPPPHLKQVVAHGTKLPVDRAKLPVVSVSFADARRFAAWLTEELVAVAPGWLVRLPHEIEWEMAARGNDTRRHAFADKVQDLVLPALRTPELNAVGQCQRDVSPFGIRDMTGNAREWTESVFNEMLLPLLMYSKSSEAFVGWRPDKPFYVDGLLEELPMPLSPLTSARISVRGGHNGELPGELLWVSVRRAAELSLHDPWIGFRLVLIPAEES